MKTCPLGKTDLNLSKVGLGTWAIGGTGWDYGWGEQSETESIASILEGLEFGINWIDTAPIYGLGKSEQAVGKALKEWGKGNNEVFVATKCGLLGTEEGHIQSCLDASSIRSELDRSLTRLQVERIDLYQIHWPNPAHQIEEAFHTLLELKQEGKIRFCGVSNFSVKQLEEVSKLGPVASLQPPYSMFKRRVEEELLPWCSEHGVGVVAYSPLQCGLLTGKVSKEWLAALDDSDWRKTKSEYFQEPQFSINLTFVSKLKRLAEEAGRTLPQLALAWVLRRKEITSVITGTRKRGQIEETVKAHDAELSTPEIDAIETLLSERIACLKELT